MKATSSGSEPPGSNREGDLGEEDGCVIGPALLDRLARIRADEEGVVAEAACHGRFGVRRGAIGVEVDDLDIAQVRPDANEAGNERVGGGGAGVDVEAVTRLHHPGGLFEGDDAHGDRMRGGT